MSVETMKKAARASVKLFKSTLLAAFSLSAVLLTSQTNQAHAGVPLSLTCSQISSGYTLSTAQHIQVTVIVGETITVSEIDSGATFRRDPDPIQSANPPVVFSFSSNGVQVFRSSSAGLNVLVTCSAATTPINTVVNQQASDLTSAIFDDALGSRFRESSGDQVTAAGFSASAKGLANTLQHKTIASYAPISKSEAAYPSPQSETMDWNAWTRVRLAGYDSEGTAFEGQSISAFVGLDRMFGNNLVVGLVGGYGIFELDTDTSGVMGEFNQKGYTLGSYAGLKISNTLQLDVFGAWTRSEYETVSGTTTGDFDANRVTVAAHLRGIFEQEKWFLEPSARIVYVREWQDSYTDSGSNLNASKIVSAGRLSLGPKIGLIHYLQSGTELRPWISAKAEYDFANTILTNSNLQKMSDFASVRVATGFQATTTGGLSMAMRAQLFGLASNQYLGYSGTARISLPF
ncbi:MAG: autotransporter outer membrane beta-barrel domain-containing protein [Cohaesibacteraceae bacterium]|nr:autotransporter outer membrane beta-barrel domain-containing protein [Cohaesibacteraceae bacterium]